MRFKGGIEDGFTIAFIVLLLGVLGVFGWFFADKIMTAFEGLGMHGLPPQLHQQAIDAFAFIDGINAFVLMVLIGGSMALAFFSRSRPFLAVIAIFTQIFYLIGAYMIKVWWQGFINTVPELSVVANQHFPLTTMIMQYLPFIIFITILGIIILFFTKPREEYAVGI